ncbi:MAG TPA: hypothetical protein VIR63_00070 [Pontiella sp.]
MIATSNCSTGCASCKGCDPMEFDMKNTLEKPLGKITGILADLGLEVTYAYDDLVFIQHSAFLIQFMERPDALRLFTNWECNPTESNTIVTNIVRAFHQAGFTTYPSGIYILEQNNDGTLKIEFTE